MASWLNKGVGEKGRWMYPFVGALIGFFTIIAVNYSELYPYLQAYFNVEETVPFAWGMSIEGLASMLIGPVVGGFVLDKYGPKATWIIFVVFNILALILIRVSLAQPTWDQAAIWFYLWSFISGFGAAQYSTTAPSMAARWFPDRTGLAMGISLIGPGFASTYFGLSIPYFYELCGLEGMFTILYISFIVIVAILGVLLWKAPEKDWAPEGWTPAASSEAENVQGITFKEAAKTVEFWLIWICVLCCTMGVFTFMGNIGSIVIDGLVNKAGFNIAEVTAAGGAMALAFSIGGIINGLGRPLWGWVLDKVGTPFPLMIAAYGGLAIAFFALINLYTTYVGVIVGVCLVFFFLSGSSPTNQAAAPYVFGYGNIGSLLGVILAATGVSNFLGPILGAYLYDSTGSFDLCITVCIVLALVALACAIILMIVVRNKKTKKAAALAQEAA